MHVVHHAAQAEVTGTRVAAAAVLAALALATAGCGEEQDTSTARTTAAADVARPASAVARALAWVKPPGVFPIPGLPTDRVLRGAIRNDTGEPVDMRVDRVKVIDGGGRSLRISVRFAEAFGHALYGPGGPPAPLQASRYDQARLGERVTVPPGEQQPITLAWRTRGGASAQIVNVSGYTLDLP